MGFINEAKYRLTDKDTPPFWKKLAKVGALITASGLAFAFVPGGLVIGGIAAAFGIGISSASIFGTKDSAATTAVKAEIKAIEKKEEKEKEAAEESIKPENK